ncbi:hypothetical protein AB0M43_09000 [Longispora sp. NPDC051575]
MNIDFLRRLGNRPRNTPRAPYPARRVEIAARRREEFRLAGR